MDLKELIKLGDDTKPIKLSNNQEKLMTCEEVFEQYKRFLHKMIQKWSGKYDYDDLFQIASIALVKAYKTYDISKNILFMTYLFQIVENEIRTYNRRESKRANDVSLYTPVQDQENIEIVDMIEDESESVEEEVLKKIDLQTLHMLLKKLKDKDRHVIEDTYMHGLTQRQISEKYNLSQSYISRLIYNALSKLERLYKNYEGVKVMESKFTREQLLELCRIHGTDKAAHKIIGEKLGISHHTVRCSIQKLGISKQLKEELQPAKEGRTEEIKESPVAVLEETDYEKMAECPNNVEIILKPVLLRGKVMEYILHENSFSIRNLTGNSTLVLSASKIDDFIKELTELKKMAG